MASEPEQYTYPGGAIDVVWDGRLCIHVGECTRARGALFEIGRQPWCGARQRRGRRGRRRGGTLPQRRDGLSR
jgi:hypothetical protein